MPEFSFEARDETGSIQTGVITAAAPSTVVDQIRSRGWLLVSVAEAVEPANANTGFLSADGIPFLGVRSMDVELSLRQMAVMLRGGLTLLSSLNVLVENSPRAATRRMWSQVIENIQAGETFSNSIEKHPSIPDYAIKLVRVGEQTGILESVLVEAADMMNSRRSARRDIMTALAYPMLVFLIALGVATYMVLFLIPRLGGFLRSMGKELPAITQSLLVVGDFFQAYGPTLLVTLLLTAGSLAAFYLSAGGRMIIDRLALRLPVIGKILRLSGTVTFAQSLGILVRSGVTVLESLITVEQMHYNRFLANCVRNAREDVIRGNSLAKALSTSRGYMPLLPSMTAVAEQAGNLDDVMDEVANFHNEQLKSMIKTLSAWVTPLITVVVGVIVGYVYIAFFLALFAVAA